jgi:hypothetical protein
MRYVETPTIIPRGSRTRVSPKWWALNTQMSKGEDMIWSALRGVAARHGASIA